MLGFKKSGPELTEFDFTDRIERDRAIAEGRMPDPRLNPNAPQPLEIELPEDPVTQTDAPEAAPDILFPDHAEQHPNQKEEILNDSVPPTGFAEDRAEFDAQYTPAHDVDRDNDVTGFASTSDDDYFADDPDTFGIDRQGGFRYGDPSPQAAADMHDAADTPSPRMLALRRWLMAAVNGLVWMFLTMWTLDKLHLFDHVFSAIDVTSTAASFYVAGIALVAVASLFVYLVKALRTVLEPSIWRTTASGLVLGGIIGAADGIGPSTHFLTMIANNIPFI